MKHRVSFTEEEKRRITRQYWRLQKRKEELQALLTYRREREGRVEELSSLLDFYPWLKGIR